MSINIKLYIVKKAKTGPAVIKSYNIGNNIATKTAKSQFTIVGKVINDGSTISAIYNQVIGFIELPVAIIQINNPTTTVMFP